MDAQNAVTFQKLPLPLQDFLPMFLLYVHICQTSGMLRPGNLDCNFVRGPKSMNN